MHPPRFDPNHDWVPLLEFGELVHGVNQIDVPADASHTPMTVLPVYLRGQSTRRASKL